MYTASNLFWRGGLFFQNVSFVVFLEQQFLFLETVASVSGLGFADITAGVDNSVDNSLDAVEIVGCDFLSTKRVREFGRIRTL